MRVQITQDSQQQKDRKMENDRRENGSQFVREFQDPNSKFLPFCITTYLAKLAGNLLMSKAPSLQCKTRKW